MGTIALQIPQAGLPNNTEDTKVANDLSTIQTVINGNLDANNLAAAAVTPAKTGTNASGMAAGLFIVGFSTVQTLASNAVLPWDTRNFGSDVASWVDITTNKGRFTPQQDGWYEFSANLFSHARTGTGTYVEPVLTKNDGSVEQVSWRTLVSAASGNVLVLTTPFPIYCNGTSDYVSMKLNTDWTNVTFSNPLGNAQVTNYNWWTGRWLGR